MDSLVEQLAPTRKIWVSTPFLFISRAAAVALDRMNEEQGAEFASRAHCLRLANGRVEAQCEANLQHSAGFACRSANLDRLANVSAEWLFTKHMFPRGQGGDRDRGQEFVSGIHCHDVNPGICDCSLPVGGGTGTVTARQLFCAGLVDVRNDLQPRLTRRAGCAPAPYHSCAYDGYSKLHGSPTSCGIVKGSSRRIVYQGDRLRVSIRVASQLAQGSC